MALVTKQATGIEDISAVTSYNFLTLAPTTRQLCARENHGQDFPSCFLGILLTGTLPAIHPTQLSQAPASAKCDAFSPAERQEQRDLQLSYGMKTLADNRDSQGATPL